MRWPWHRVEHPGPVRTPDAQDLPSRGANAQRTDDPGWRDVPALQRTVHELAPIASYAHFSDDLATRHDPRFLEPLGHELTPDAPAGEVDGLVAPQPAHDLALTTVVYPVPPSRANRIVSSDTPPTIQRAAAPALVSREASPPGSGVPARESAAQTATPAPPTIQATTETPSMALPAETPVPDDRSVPAEQPAEEPAEQPVDRTGADSEPQAPAVRQVPVEPRPLLGQTPISLPEATSPTAATPAPRAPARETTPAPAPAVSRSVDLGEPPPAPVSRAADVAAPAHPPASPRAVAARSTPTSRLPPQGDPPPSITSITWSDIHETGWTAESARPALEPLSTFEPVPTPAPSLPVVARTVSESSPAVPTTGDEAGHPDRGQIESTTLSTTPSVVPLVGEREDAPPIERPDDLPLTPTDAPSPVDQPTPLPSLRTVEYAGPPPTSFTPPVVSRTTLPTVEVRTRPSTSVQRAVTGASETTPLTSKQQPGLHQPSTPTRPASSETPLTERARPSMELPIVDPVVATRPVSQALPAIQRVAAVPGADLSPPSHDLAGVVRPAATSAGVRRGAMRESGQPTDPPNRPMRPSAQRVLDPVRTPATPEPGRVSVLPLQRMFADVAPAPQSDAGSAGFAVQRDQEAGTSLVWQRVSGDEGVVAPADRPAEDEPPSSSPAPATPSPPSEPAVASEPAAEAAAPPTEAPAATPAASTPTASGAAAPPSAAELDEMAKRLYEPVSARLRSELWLDLERHGLVTARSR